MQTDNEIMEQSPAALARERLVSDLKALSVDAEALLKVTAGDVSEKVKQARERLGAALERSRAAYSEAQHQAIERAKLAAKKADTVIRDHPYQSIGVALGLGILIGVLAARR